MANVARVEAVISAQDKLRPGLSSAARALETFRRQQSKATPIFAAQKMLDYQAGLLKRAAGIAATYVGAQQVKDSVVRFADVDRAMRRAAITGEAGEERIASATAEVRKIAMETATPIQQVQQGLDSLTASGLEFEKSMQALPTVVKVAQATGSAVADIATTTTAAMDNFGIVGRDLEKTYDILAKGGKLGKFELKDMARYLPSMLPAAKAVGLAGTEGMEKLVAMLQTVRLGSGSAEEAASSMSNIFAKMESEETAKRFKKFGIDLRKEMDAARKGGKDLLEVFTDLSAKALKGDLSKLPQLFPDMEFARGMRAWLSNRDKVKEFLADLKGAGGTINTDFARVSKDTRAELDRLAEGFDRAKAAAGKFAAAVGAIKALQVGADALERGANVLTENDPEGRLYPGRKEEIARRPAVLRFESARDEMARTEAEIARMEASPRAYRPQEVEAARKRLAAQRMRLPAAMQGVMPVLPPEPNGLNISGMGWNYPDREGFPRYPGAAIHQEVGKRSGAPLPPARPKDFGTFASDAFPVQPLEEAKAKAEEVKQKVGEIGPAGASSAGQLSGAFSAEFGKIRSDAQSLASEINTIFAGIKPPALGGRGGLNTGKSMGEVQ